MKGSLILSYLYLGRLVNDLSFSPRLFIEEFTPVTSVVYAEINDIKILQIYK